MNQVLREQVRQRAGYKRHIIADTLGLLLIVVVSAASVTERDLLQSGGLDSNSDLTIFVLHRFKIPVCF